MKYAKETTHKILGAAGIFAILLTLFISDYGTFFEKIANYWVNTNSAATKVTVYLAVIDFYTKITLGLLFALAWTITYIVFLVVYDFNCLSLRKFNVSHIVRQLTRGHIPRNITIFGYSLSFAEELRMALEEKVCSDLIVTLFISDEEYVKSSLRDSQTVESRIAEIGARIQQWEQLKEDKKLSDVIINRSAVVQFAASVARTVDAVTGIGVLVCRTVGRCICYGIRAADWGA